MLSFISHFATMPMWQRLAIVIGCLAVSWLLESTRPLARFGYSKVKHACVNLTFLLTSIVVSLSFGLVVYGVLELHQLEVGLLHLVTLPVWAQLAVSLLVLDFLAQYCSHAILHRYRFLWKWHMVHHSDTTVDATSGTRHHPGDFLWREIFSLLAILVTGMPFAFYAFYRVLVTPFFTYLTHANVRVPEWLDRPASWIFITPNLHKFHHHAERPWTNTNYGGVLSIWDRLFGTFTYGDPAEVRYGLDVLEATRDQDLRYQFGIPFNKTIRTE